MASSDSSHIVLIADPLTSERLSRVLRDSHHRIGVVSSPSMTVSEVLALRPDLVILAANDIRADAVALCKALKNSENGTFLPVIMVLVAGISADDEAAISEQSWADVVLHADTAPAMVRRQATTLLALRARVDELEAQNQALQVKLEEQGRTFNQVSQQARELSVLRDSIINNVSHELRTPLLQVKSAVAMLDNEARSNPLINGMERVLEYATQATSRLESVVNNISQLATSLSLKSEPFRVADSVSSAMRQISRSWSLANETSRIRPQLNEVPPVMADKNGIATVLKELIANGLKFSPEGSPVDVFARLVESGVEVAVKDYGIGLDAHQIDRIFQPFYQVEQGAARRYGGAGTGLAIVKLILDKLNIPIRVESRPNEGSTFSFVLPLASLL